MLESINAWHMYKCMYFFFLLSPENVKFTDVCLDGCWIIVSDWSENSVMGHIITEGCNLLFFAKKKKEHFYVANITIYPFFLLSLTR